MFCYCLNNPITLKDNSGRLPIFSGLKSLLDKAISVLNSAKNKIVTAWERVKKYSVDKKIGEKVQESIHSVTSNLEFSAGLGQGLYVETSVGDMGVGFGMYGNYNTINYKDGELYTGQEMHVGFSVSLTQIFEIGFGEDSFRRKGELKYTESSWRGFNNTQESWTLYSVAVYPLFAGFSIRIGFDAVNFAEEVDSIWRGGE